MLDAKLKAMQVRTTEALNEHPSHVQAIFGVGAVTTAVILDEVGDVRRFPNKHHVASYTALHPTMPAAATPSGTASTAVGTGG